MKVSINSPASKGFGGGISFVSQLKQFLTDHNVEVVNHLDDNDIDIILHVNVTYTFVYTFYKAYLYKIKHPKVVIIHRVNDSGYHRTDGLMTHLMTLCSHYSDYLVYISNWLKSEMLGKLNYQNRFSVIHNGGDPSVINSLKVPWDKRSKLKIVTHHWSSNYDKGHDIYQYLDDLLAKKEFSDKYEFTYIGNYPKSLEYVNTRLLPVMSKKELSDELSRHHIYLTASINEAAGMHIIEGCLAGLPPLYFESGGIPEYAQEYGIGFDKNTFIEQLEKISTEYDEYFLKLEDYKYTSDRMARQYLTLFEKLSTNREVFLERNKKQGFLYNSKCILIIKYKMYKYYLRYYSYFK